MASFILIKVAHKPHEPVSSIVDFFEGIRGKSFKEIDLLKVCFKLLGVVFGVVFGEVEVLKLHGLIFAYFVLNLFSFVDKPSQSVVVIQQHILLSLLLLLHLLPQFNVFQHVNLFLHQIVH